MNKVKLKESSASDGQKTKTLLGLTCFVASLGGVLFGFDTAVISGTFGMVETQFGLSKLMVGWFGSSALIGAIVGAFIAGTLSDRFGRKPILILAALLFFVSAFFSSVPPSFTLLIVARLVGGLGVGMASVLSPMYISEFAPAKIRGRLVALYQLSIVLGILLAYFSNWALLRYAASPDNIFTHGILQKVFNTEIWRGMFAAEMVPCGLFILLLFFVPESPRWLIDKGFVEKGVALLKRINGELDEKLLHPKKEDKKKDVGIRELLKPGMRRALAVGIGLSVFGQFTGVNIVIYYGPTILEGAGFALDNAVQFQVLIGIINLIFTVIALTKIDSWGRRPLLIGGMTAVFVSLCAIGTLFVTNIASGIWTVVLLCIYIGSLALSINAVIWVIIGEIYPTHIRGRAMSLATFANWGTNFAAAFLFPWYVANVGMGAGFFTFAAFCLAGTIFFYKLIPETKGKSLEEIERYWMEQAKQ
ncbi:sugar porter family MFS transporter [Sunxiuqinia elliptica]|uniref:Sugar porter (SP) family MFS transporter n=1 Tax=Sunxiuqinia elliptica TaxID=655355 RepID=A0A4R6H6W3_9BACT|nr:sugar porter family MFS transporter [Sunxiuqinia elliptica]TDO03256.1 sugar porter (SP) family MFS transporter [Sunxiuqinia elliptica]TDO59453.1 sugar porter (SP) family MFS transporter [Sunxiuqinia elliptica]